MFAVLVRIHANAVESRPFLARGIQHAQTSFAGGVEDNVRALGKLVVSNDRPFGVVGPVSNVPRNDPDVRVGRLRAGDVPTAELRDERRVPPAHETYGARLGHFGSQIADQEAALFLPELQREAIR